MSSRSVVARCGGLQPRVFVAAIAMFVAVASVGGWALERSASAQEAAPATLYVESAEGAAGLLVETQLLLRAPPTGRAARLEISLRFDARLLQLTEITAADGWTASTVTSSAPGTAQFTALAHAPCDFNEFCLVASLRWLALEAGVASVELFAVAGFDSQSRAIPVESSSATIDISPQAGRVAEPAAPGDGSAEGVVQAAIIVLLVGTALAPVAWVVRRTRRRVAGASVGPWEPTTAFAGVDETMASYFDHLEVMGSVPGEQDPALARILSEALSYRTVRAADPPPTDRRGSVSPGTPRRRVVRRE